MTEPRAGEYPVPTNARTTKCVCGALIIWTKTDNGSAMPLSAATVREDELGQKFALPHFTDCPNAKQFRKPKQHAPSLKPARPTSPSPKAAMWTITPGTCPGHPNIPAGRHMNQTGTAPVCDMCHPDPMKEA